MKKYLLSLIGIALLILAPGNLLSQNKPDLDTTLTGAAKRNDLSLVKKLVSHGADVNYQDNTGATVLMWAAQNDNLQMVKYLTGKGAEVDKEGTLDNGSFIFKNTISIAVKNRNADMVYYLLKVCKCTISKSDVLFQEKNIPYKGFDLKDFDKGDYNDGVILSYLFLNGLEISLFDLIDFDETEWAVKDYLKYHYDSLDIRDSQNRSLLHAAAFRNRLDLARFLLREGADPNDQDEDGATPYYLAKQEGNEDILKLLLSNGADTSIYPPILEKANAKKEKSTTPKPFLGLPYGHTARITSVNYSPDGKLIITGSEDHSAKLWEASSGKLLHSLDDHSGSVVAVSFSPDMKYIITETNEKFVKIWSTLTGELLQDFILTSKIRSFLSPDSKSIFVPNYDGIEKFDIESGDLIFSMEKNPPSEERTSPNLTAVSINYEGNLIVTASEDSTAAIWNAISGRIIKVLPEINSKITDIMFSHNSKFIIMLTPEPCVQIRETKSGELLFNLKGLGKKVMNMSISPDDKYFLAESADNTARVWSTADGSLLYSISQEILFSNHHYSFSNDSKYLLTVFSDFNSTNPENSFSVREISTGNILYTLKTNLKSAHYIKEESKIVLVSLDSIRTLEVPSWKILTKVSSLNQFDIFSGVYFSPDNKYILQTSNNNSVYGINIIDLSTGIRLSEMSRHAFRVLSADFNMGNDGLIITSEKGIKILDLRNGNEVKQINSRNQKNGILSPDKKLIALTGITSEFVAYGIPSGERIISLNKGYDVGCVAYNPSGKQMAVGYLDSSVYIMDCKSGEIIKSRRKLPGRVNNVSYSPDGNFLGLALLNGKTLIMNTSDYSDYMTLTGPQEGTNSIEFSHNGKLAVSSYNKSYCLLWDLKTSALPDTLKTDKRWVSRAIFTPDDKYIITTSSTTTRENFYDTDLYGLSTMVGIGVNANFGKIQVFETSTRSSFNIMKGHMGGVDDISFSPDGNLILSASLDHTAIIWNCPDSQFIFPQGRRELLFRLEGHKARINSARFSSDGKYIVTASDDSRIKIWNVATGKEILTYIPIDTNDWVVMSPSGLFDATPGAMKLMYYVQGLDVIDLDQLKERYYEPNLWSKLMGYNPEPVRDVKGLEEIKMYPSSSLKINNDDLIYTLTDHGGGIGKYMIYINGKEAFSGNQPKDSLGFRGGNILTSTLSLKGHPFLIPGQENEIVIKAYNKENYLVSRGEKISYFPGGSSTDQKPRLFIVSSGISDYTGDLIDLRYAAKDAEDMTKALDIGASRLFGTEATFTYKLTTNNPERTTWPTKANIEEAFKKVAMEAKASDILIVYLSGHGINLGDQDADFFYLTQDAYTSNIEAYKDVAIRNKTTISSSELTDLIKKIPALKQVLIIDACGSGKTVDNLMAKREISSSTLRALDRMKDRTGLHIITGCAADAVSFEASKYGQGVLTYSLLEGMKGASLRDDRFVDVVKLFQYGRERVPELAEGIGGIQQPQVFSPYGEASFDIGEINPGDKALIHLQPAKPIIIMSSLKDKETFDDILGIEKLVDDKLIELSYKNQEAPFIFINAKDFPEAYKIRGQYTVSQNEVEVTVNIFKGTKKVSTFITRGVKNDLKKISDEIIKKISF